MPTPLADLHPDHQHPLQRGSTLTRRDALRAGALSIAAAGAAPLLASPARAAARPAPGARIPVRARNIIFMVSDGMSTGTLSLADMHIRRTSSRPSHWTSLWSQPGTKRSAARTHSLDSLVTDSAAGGSAWGSGRHINNGFINVLPDGAQLLPILVHAQQSGKATGVVTTARITHATPASFYANSPSRNLEGMIAAQLLDRNIDVALGGGAKFFPDSELARHPHVQVVRTAAELRAAKSDGRLVGIFDREHVPYFLDRSDAIPSLPEMARVALSRLEHKPDGFVLQIEGGRVDHAAHNNDAASLLQEQCEFDDAIGAVLDWCKDRTDTLIILTSDHGNANPGLTLYGEQGNKAFDRLASARKSFDWIAAQVHGIKPADARMAKMAEAVKAATGYDLSAAERSMLESVLHEQRIMPFAEANKWTSVLGALLTDHFAVAFLSPNHTADYVEVTARGPGSEPIAGLIDNIDLHALMLEALSLPPGQLLPSMAQPMPLTKLPKPD